MMRKAELIQMRREGFDAESRTILVLLGTGRAWYSFPLRNSAPEARDALNGRKLEPNASPIHLSLELARSAGTRLESAVVYPDNAFIYSRNGKGMESIRTSPDMAIMVSHVAGITLNLSGVVPVDERQLLIFFPCIFWQR